MEVARGAWRRSPELTRRLTCEAIVAAWWSGLRGSVICWCWLRGEWGSASELCHCSSGGVVPRGAVRYMMRITLREFRDGAGRVLDGVERTGEPVIITKYERPVAVLLGIDEWEEIEAFRDSRDSAVIARSRADGEFVPLSAALESLGVDPREVEAPLADRANGEAA